MTTSTDTADEKGALSSHQPQATHYTTQTRQQTADRLREARTREEFRDILMEEAARENQRLQSLSEKIDEIVLELKAKNQHGGKHRLIETLMDTQGNSYKKEYRPTLHEGTLYTYCKGSRRYIIPYSIGSHTVDLELRHPTKDKALVWLDSWRKAKGHLEKSGLWQDLLKQIETALDIGYQRINDAYSLYWRETDDASRARAIAAIDARLSDGREVNTEILWRLKNRAKIKKMHFGPNNEEKLRHIEDAIRNGRDCSTSGRTSYDVSFNYNHTAKKAWYCEEFKNCGNGHYYLALSGTHALFYEDD